MSAAERVSACAAELVQIERTAVAGEAVLDSAALVRLAEFLCRYPDTRSTASITRLVLDPSLP